MEAPAEVIRDPADPRVAAFADLRDPLLRRRHGLFVAEGREVVRLLLATRRYRVRALLVAPAALAALGDALRDATPAVTAYVAGPEVMRAITGFPFHRGCLALAERGPDLGAAALAAPPGPRTLVALDELADPDNVGAVFRNARAFAADGVLLSPGSADPLYRKAIRTSTGATLTLPFARAEDWAADLGALRALGYALLALTPDPAADDVSALGAPPARLALLVGSEGAGLGAASRQAAHRRVRIPMAAGVDSLNVATATGIALHALRGARADP
jgi:tRNA G18 (ribose-2'-O)-methylase SpoU